MIFGTFSFRGCRGQSLALVWNIRVKSQMCNTAEHAFKEKSAQLLILLPLITIYFYSFQCETPCRTEWVLCSSKPSFRHLNQYCDCFKRWATRKQTWIVELRRKVVEIWASKMNIKLTDKHDTYICTTNTKDILQNLGRYLGVWKEKS